MQVLLRYITHRSEAGVSHSDHEVQGDTLTIGRGSDADLFLSDLHVALHHAVLRHAAEGRYTIQARTPSGVKINERTVQTGNVRPGDTIGVGLSTLRLQRGDDGHDLVIEIEETRARSGEATDAGATTLQEAGLGRRRWAWAAFALILLVGVIVPLGHMYSEDAATAAPAGGDAAAPAGPGTGGGLVGVVPWHLAGGDQLWDSGGMSRPHRFFGRECSQCHRQPFQRVTTAACLDCHEGQAHHGNDADLMQAVGLSERRCASCHREHSGLEAMVGTDPRLCIDCHAEPGETMPGAGVEPVAGFLGDSHPEFRIRLVSMSDAGEASWRRVRMNGAVSESNGLVFPHDVHMADDGVRGPDGPEQLACADCHRPGADGAAMEPVRFERDCQGCHKLDFAAGDPGRELPHGEPAAVLATLEEYYARVALEGGYDNAETDPPEVVRRQRPGGQQLEEDERQVALDWSRQWAGTVAAEVFEYRTCKTCHQVERRPETEAGWEIAPVAMTQDWFPAHRFDHEPHQQSACTECHAATESASADDVLVPGRATCLQCHGDSDSLAQVASRCVDCHAFHTADELEMDGHALTATGME